MMPKDTTEWLMCICLFSPLIVIFLSYVIPRVLFKIKYPIISETPPMMILKIDDTVILNNREYTFKGRRADDPNFYWFMPEDSIFCIDIEYEKFYQEVSSISNEIGLKWKKPEKCIVRK